jgi:hypothetical protein
MPGVNARAWQPNAKAPNKPVPCLVEVPDMPGWSFTFWMRRDGTIERLEVTGEVTDTTRWHNAVQQGRRIPAAPAPVEGITRRMLRDVPLGGFVVAMRTEANHSLDDLPPIATGVVTAALERFAVIPRPGRSGRDDYDYATFAAMYVERVPSPTAKAELADELGLSPTQVGHLLYEARKRDLLTEAPRGKAGGELTDKARRLLEEGVD